MYFETLQNGQCRLQMLLGNTGTYILFVTQWNWKAPIGETLSEKFF